MVSYARVMLLDLMLGVFARGKEEVEMIVVPVGGCQVHRGVQLHHSTGVGLVT